MNGIVELVSTGNELLSGRTVNLHAQTIGARLGELGIPLARDTTVGDNPRDIEDALRGALSRADVVVVTGGLGPTMDDLTRDAVASVTGRGIVMDEGSLERIRFRYTKTGRAMNPSVARHALVLEGAEVLSNSVGLAPGERIAWEGKTIFLLPGPPRELKAVLEEHVLPWIRVHVPVPSRPYVRTFQVCGIGESDLMTRLEKKGFVAGEVFMETCAQPGRVEVRLKTATGLRDAVDRATAVLREAAGDYLFAEGTATMAEVVADLLRARSATLATAESCTGGMIGARLTDLAGASAWYVGGVVAYSNDSKVRDLSVNAAVLERWGAVSGEAARQMAEGIRRRFAAAYGLAVTGIAGPTGGSAEKPVGLVYAAVSDERGQVDREFRFGGDRASIREWSSALALDLLRRRLLGLS
jgi:nicotinamide-nucleotide amidase